MVEVRISSGGEHYHGTEQSEDMYASIDKVVDKVERQIRSGKGALEEARGNQHGQFAAAAAVEAEGRNRRRDASYERAKEFAGPGPQKGKSP